MSSAPASNRLSDLLRATPALAAVAIFGVAQARLYLGLPLIVAILVLIARRIRWSHSTRALVICAGTGAAVGVASLLVDRGNYHYFLNGLCGGFAALVVYCIGIRSIQGGGVCSWVLVALSTNVHQHPFSLEVAIAALIVGTQAAAMAEAQAWRAAGWTSVAWAALFTTLALPSHYYLSRLAEASVDPILGMVLRLASEAPHPHGVGLDSELRVRRISQVADDSTVLFEVSSPAPDRLRTVVFDRFDGETWRASDGLLKAGAKLAPGGDHQLEITFAEEVGPTVPSPASASSITGVPIEVHGGGVATSSVPLRTRSVDETYDARNLLPAESGQGDADLPSDLAAELRPLALGIVGRATSTADRASALERFFADNFEYSLDTDLSGKGNPLVLLIREHKPAYCIYFASAAAALLRSLGIPARLAGGFVLGNENPFTKRFAVRAKDAHVWVEVYRDDLGRFVGIDPTPWRSRSALTPLPSHLEFAFQALRSALRLWYLAAGGTPGQAILAVFRSKTLIALVVIAVLLRWVRIRRRPRAEAIDGAAQVSDQRLLAAHHAYEQVLFESGVNPSSPHETDREAALRLQSEAARAAEAFLRSYELARFGGGTVPADDWSGELAALKKSLPPKRA